MVLPTGVATPGIKKKKMQASAAAVGGPSGQGFVAPEVADMATERNEAREDEQLPQTGYVPPQPSSSPGGVVEDMKEGRHNVGAQNRQPGKMGDLPSSIAAPSTGSTSQANEVPPPADDPGYVDPNAPLDDAAMATDISENDLDDAAYLRALGLLRSGNPVTDEELANTRAAANRAGADELRRQRALFGGAGFGTSGLAASSLTDAATAAALQTEQQVSDLRAAGRAEQLQNILAGGQLGQSQRRSRNDQERNALIMQLLQAELGLDEGSVNEADYDTDGDGQVDPELADEYTAAVAAQAEAAAENMDPLEALANGNLDMFRDKSREQIAAMLVKNGVPPDEADAMAVDIFTTLTTGGALAAVAHYVGEKIFGG